MTLFSLKNLTKKSKKEEEKCFIFVNFVGALFFHAMQRNAMQRTLLLKFIYMGRAGEEENKLFQFRWFGT